MSYTPDWLIRLEDAVKLKQYLEEKENATYGTKLGDSIRGFPEHFNQQVYDELSDCLKRGIEDPIDFKEVSLVCIAPMEWSSGNWAIQKLLKERKIDFRITNYDSEYLEMG